MTNSGRSYRDAGVDINLAKQAIDALVSRVTFRRSGAYGMVGEVGHYAGLIDFGDHVLGLTTDGVGTKMLIADRLQNWRTIGIDCIAMNANDLLVMNVEPVAFVDYIATDRLSVAKMAQIGEGLNEGARQANINIVGGETAQLKGLISGLDLAGTCLGVQRRDRLVTGRSIVPGDLVVGVPSSGIHSNGLTLARKIVEDCADYQEKLPSGKTVGDELLTPTRIYRDALTIAAGTAVHGMCHVTGGGLLNFTRLTRYGFDFTDPIHPPEIFRWLERTGNVAIDEMYRTFNMGMGYAFVVPDAGVDTVLRVYPEASIVGTIVNKRGVFLDGIEVH